MRMLSAASGCRVRLRADLHSFLAVITALITLAAHYPHAAASMQSLRCCDPERTSACSAPAPPPVQVASDEVRARNELAYLLRVDLAQQVVPSSHLSLLLRLKFSWLHAPLSLHAAVAAAAAAIFTFIPTMTMCTYFTLGDGREDRAARCSSPVHLRT
jgi:hypothetical protein